MDDDIEYDDFEDDQYGYHQPPPPAPPRVQRGQQPRGILKHRGSPPPPRRGKISSKPVSRVKLNLRPNKPEEEEYEEYEPYDPDEGEDNSGDAHKVGDAVAGEESSIAGKGIEETVDPTKEYEGSGTAGA